ncbi:MAG: tRNA pseudouridine(55) synthase TruB [Clostridia bacterium]|nr:tRNA pseudouridine(55) synthase TruB [Clostridia bacterium]
MTQINKPLCGFLNVLKPPGMSSAHVVGAVRRMLGGAKIGHAGTLDPEAAGVLPLMVGKAARLFDYMQDKEKAYVTEVAFGASTDTQDAQGAVIETGDCFPDESALVSALPRFTGTIMQTPPMYSALKQDGKRLYQLARDGKQADIPAREVTVHELAFRGMTENHGALLHVRCSKGFYVRTLCQDLGQALGCPSHMRFLLRTQSGPFTLETAKTLEELQAAAEKGTLADMLLPPEAALAHLPMTNVPRRLEKAVRNGGKLDWERFTAVHDTSAAEGTPFGLWMDGMLAAIAQRQGDAVKVRTWLGD